MLGGVLFRLLETGFLLAALELLALLALIVGGSLLEAGNEAEQSEDRAERTPAK
jgi:hypothetical protein